MEGFSNGGGRDQAAFMTAPIPSFTHSLSSYAPDLLPVRDLGALAGNSDLPADVIKSLPHPTTIAAVVSECGAVMAGDRRATAGNMISKRGVGSGSVFARSALEQYYSGGMPVTDAILACVQALCDAADDGSATGGPDLTRRISPVTATITGDGSSRVTDAESADYAYQVVDGRMRLPDGPSAPLRAAS